LTVAHISPQRGSLSSCAGETKAAIALGVTAAITFINSYVTSRFRQSGRITIGADYIAALRCPFVNGSDIAAGVIINRGERKLMRDADAVSRQLRTSSVGDLVENDRLRPRAQSIRLIFENNKFSWYPGAGHFCRASRV